jgi:hypothetical protein
VKKTQYTFFLVFCLVFYLANPLSVQLGLLGPYIYILCFKYEGPHEFLKSKQDWGTPFESWESTLRTFKFTFFFTFSHDLSYISSFFFMSNEIILFQILYKLLKYLFFSLMKVKIKIYPILAMFYQWSKIPKFLTFWNFWHCNGAFGSCHIHTFYTR